MIAMRYGPGNIMEDMHNPKVARGRRSKIVTLSTLLLDKAAFSLKNFREFGSGLCSVPRQAEYLINGHTNGK